MTEDDVTILCDGYSAREHPKPETERDWNHVAQKLDGVDRTARTIKFDLLGAAAIRTPHHVRARNGSTCQTTQSHLQQPLSNASQTTTADFSFWR